MSSRHRLSRTTTIARTVRVKQVEGMFDVPVAERSSFDADVTLDLDGDWHVGLIVGPSGSGKSSLLADAFGGTKPLRWTKGALVDDMPGSISEATGALSAVGLSSPPAWLRPYSTLSNGEQFRADLARRLLLDRDPIVVDEFTSVVDRQVAQVASSAVAKHVRRIQRRLVVASCHFDIIDWLQPDWIVTMPDGSFTRRSVQPRPPIDLEIARTTRDTWNLFRRHHYLSAELLTSSKCYLALVNDRPAAFVAVTKFPHPRAKNIWREHRAVCLPDFQGVGIGNAMSEFVASLYATRGQRYRSITSHPAMIRHRARSPLWRMDRTPSMVAPSGRNSTTRAASATRITASFEYVGPTAPGEHQRLRTS